MTHAAGEHVAVRQRLGTAHVVDAASRRLGFREAKQVLDQVIEGDRLCERVHPTGGHHNRQVIDQVTDDLEGGRPAPHDYPGPNFAHRHRPGSQHLPGLSPGGQVERSRLPWLETSQVDDATHSGARRRVLHMCRRTTVQLREPLPGGHRVDQVVDDIDAFERINEGIGVESVGTHHLHPRPPAGFECLRSAPGSTHRVTPLHQSGDQMATHVAGGTEYEHLCHSTLLALVKAGRRTRIGRSGTPTACGYGESLWLRRS